MHEIRGRIGGPRSAHPPKNHREGIRNVVQRSQKIMALGPVKQQHRFRIALVHFVFYKRSCSRRQASSVGS